MTASSKAAQNLNVIVGSNRDEFKNYIVQLLSQLGGINVAIFKDSSELIESGDLVENPILCLVDYHETAGSILEWLQTLSSSYTNCKCILVYESNELIDEETFRKNGASGIFHRFFDIEHIENAIAKAIPPDFVFTTPPLTLLAPIHFSDLVPDMETKFDIYLNMPTNKKTILLKKSGEMITQESISKYQKLNARIYIRKSLLESFIDFSRRSGVGTGDHGGFYTEMVMKFKKSLFQITSQLLNKKNFNYQDGKGLYEFIVGEMNASGLLKDFTPDEYGPILTKFSQESRSINNDMIHLAAYSNIFCLALNIEASKRQSLVIAALLHNIGVAKVGEFELRPEYEHNGDNAVKFKNYPLESINLLKEKKLSFEKEVFEGIEHHREKMDGTGFPKSLKGSDISEAGKFLGFVFRFYETTSIASSKSDILTPKSALQNFKQEALNGQGPHDMTMVLELAKRIKF